MCHVRIIHCFYDSYNHKNTREALEKFFTKVVSPQKVELVFEEDGSSITLEIDGIRFLEIKDVKDFGWSTTLRGIN